MVITHSHAGVNATVAVDCLGLTDLQVALDMQNGHVSRMARGSACDLIDLLVFQSFVPLLTPELAGETEFPEKLISAFVREGLVVPVDLEDRSAVSSMKDKAYALTPRTVTSLEEIAASGLSRYRSDRGEMRALTPMDLREYARQQQAEMLKGWRERIGNERYHEVDALVPGDLDRRLGLPSRDHVIWYADFLPRAMYYQEASANQGFQYGAAKIRSLTLRHTNAYDELGSHRVPSIGSAVLSLFPTLEIGRDWPQAFADLLMNLRGAATGLFSVPQDQSPHGGGDDKALLMELASRINAIHLTSYGRTGLGALAGGIAALLTGSLQVGSVEPGVIGAAAAAAAAFTLVRREEPVTTEASVHALKHLRLLHVIARPSLVSIH